MACTQQVLERGFMTTAVGLADRGNATIDPKQATLTASSVFVLVAQRSIMHHFAAVAEPGILAEAVVEFDNDYFK